MPTPAATSLLTEEHTEETVPQKKKRSRLTWPLIALIVLLVLVLGGTLAVVATIGRFCEQSKSTYKAIFLSAWRGAAYLRGRYLAGA